jgi:hypothetical protein
MRLFYVVFAKNFEYLACMTTPLYFTSPVLNVVLFYIYFPLSETGDITGEMDITRLNVCGRVLL